MTGFFCMFSCFGSIFSTETCYYEMSIYPLGLAFVIMLMQSIRLPVFACGVAPCQGAFRLLADPLQASSHCSPPVLVSLQPAAFPVFTCVSTAKTSCSLIASSSLHSRDMVLAWAPGSPGSPHAPVYHP